MVYCLRLTSFSGGSRPAFGAGEKTWVYLFHEIAGYSPLSVFIQHGSDGLNGGFLILERRRELDDDIFPIGCSGQRCPITL